MNDATNEPAGGFPSTKEAWWAGFRAALNLPDGTSREDAMRVRDLLVGNRAVLHEEAFRVAANVMSTTIPDIGKTVKNRYCASGMCVASDKYHEPGCSKFV